MQLLRIWDGFSKFLSNMQLPTIKNWLNRFYQLQHVCVSFCVWHGQPVWVSMASVLLPPRWCKKVSREWTERRAVWAAIITINGKARKIASDLTSTVDMGTGGTHWAGTHIQPHTHTATHTCTLLQQHLRVHSWWASVFGFVSLTFSLSVSSKTQQQTSMQK